MADKTNQLVTLREAKQQCRLEVNADENDETGGGHPDDSYLKQLTQASITAFEVKTNRLLFPEGNPPADAPYNALAINPLIKQGVLMLISHWYENRETVVIGMEGSQVPLTFEFIFEPYRFFIL